MRTTKLLLVILCVYSTERATMQVPSAADALWSGWARCQVDVVGPGYADRRTHTWILSGGQPRIEGAFRIFNAVWSVVGSGSIDRVRGGQTLTSRWAVNAQSTNAPIAVWVRASDARLFITARHSQLRGAGGIEGYEQYANDGKPEPPGHIAAEAYEWAFPMVEDMSTSAGITGTSSTGVVGSVGYMQQPGARTTVSCTWRFARGASVPAPQVVAPQAVPTPPLPGAAPAPPPVPQKTTTGTPMPRVVPLPPAIQTQRLFTSIWVKERLTSTAVVRPQNRRTLLAAHV